MRRWLSWPFRWLAGVGIAIAAARPAALFFVWAVSNLVVSLAEPKVKLPFFEVSAQVIPVLILALAFERRLFSRPVPNERPSERYRAFPLLVALILGESSALSAVASGRVHLRWTEGVISALITAGVAFTATALEHPEEQRPARARRRRKPR
jgi:hypothetical protein